MAKASKENSAVYEEHNHASVREREDKHQCQCAACKAHRSAKKLAAADQQPAGGN